MPRWITKQNLKQLADPWLSMALVLAGAVLILIGISSVSPVIKGIVLAYILIP